MSDPNCSPEELLAYVDEMLSPERTSEIEALLRDHEALRERLRQVIRNRDMGVHSVGEIWRRERLTCPDRSELGNHILGTLDTAESNYIEFHIYEVGCRICRANLDDLQKASAADGEQVHVRRQRYFESSAGYLQGSDDSSM